MTIELLNGSEVELKPLTVGMVHDAMKHDNEMMQSISLVASSLGKTVAEVKELDVRDFTKLQEGIASFLPQGATMGQIA